MEISKFNWSWHDITSSVRFLAVGLASERSADIRPYSNPKLIDFAREWDAKAVEFACPG